MQIVPLRPVPAQLVTVILEGQVCQLAVRQRATGLFCDLAVDDEPVVSGVLCHNRCRIVRSPAFSGDLAFLDTQGTDDPVYTGLGGRFSLAYVTAAELEGIG